MYKRNKRVDAVHKVFVERVASVPGRQS
jgi:hypothetical protein